MRAKLPKADNTVKITEEVLMKIAFVTDSGTGRTINELAENGIISIPLQIIDGNTAFQDMETIDRQGCLDLLAKGHVLKTSQPSYGLIMECFESLKKQGVELIIAVPICNGLSGTISSMTSCAEELGLRIICIDTYVTAEVQYYLIRRIKELYEQGYTDMEIKLIVDEVINSCNTLILPRNLDTLVRGGRLTPVAAGFAKLLKIVPLLKINKSTGGRIDSIANVRTYRRAVKETIRVIEADHPGKGYVMYIAHVNALSAAEELAEELRASFPAVDLHVIELCNPVAAHTGPDCIALQYFRTV